MARTGRPPLDPAESERRLAIAETATGHHFCDRELLRRALTHPSFTEGRSTDPGYERLEFLGDAVISLVVSEELFGRFPHLREGELTKLRVGAVTGGSLASAASELGLADALFVGEGERREQDRGLASALENVFEALVAALYLDAGIEPARAFVSRTLGHHLGEEGAAPVNPKGDLQEIMQARGLSPSYRISDAEGPPHDRTFTALVEVGDRTLGTGTGRTKKEAEARAAASALEALSKAAEAPDPRA